MIWPFKRRPRGRPPERCYVLDYAFPQSDGLGYSFIMQPGVELRELTIFKTDVGSWSWHIIARGLPEKFDSPWKPMEQPDNG